MNTLTSTTLQVPLLRQTDIDIFARSLRCAFASHFFCIDSYQMGLQEVQHLKMKKEALAPGNPRCTNARAGVLPRKPPWVCCVLTLILPAGCLPCLPQCSHQVSFVPLPSSFLSHWTAYPSPSQHEESYSSQHPPTLEEVYVGEN